LLEQVNLMTPENIHINSFMYEPILDMSNQHLKSLLTDVKALVPEHKGARRIKSPPTSIDAGTISQQAPAWNLRACIRIAGAQMAWNGRAAVRTHLRAGAKANRSLRSRFVCWLSGGDSRHAAGARSGGRGSPLCVRPRIARIPFQSTSGVARPL